MMRTRMLALLKGIVLSGFAIAVVVEPFVGHATTINFSPLSQPGDSWADVGNSINQNGFTFTSGNGDFFVWQASSPNLPGLVSANTSLFEFYAGADTSLTHGGAAFMLTSIDLAPLIAGASGTFDVTFTGMRADTSTVSQAFTVHDDAGLQTFDFSHFTDVVSVSFQQGQNSGYFVAQDTAYQFDNVVVSSPTNPVHEPATLLLLGSGLAGLAGLAWRKN